MNIVFMGSGTLGLPTLVRLCETHTVGLVVSQPDKPAGRKRKLTPTPIAEWAQRRGLGVIKPEKCGSDGALDAVRGAKPDVIFVAAYGQYIPTKLLALAELGEMNLHPSLLPRWRGAAPVNFTLLGGDARCGNSLIRVAKEMDTGDILAQADYPVEPAETAGDLHDRLAELAPDLVIDTLAKMEAGTLEPIVQDGDAATYASKLSKDDAWVDFNEPADVVHCRINGLNPWPSVTAYWSQPGGGEKHELKLRRAQAEPERSHDAEPGTLLGDGLVACGGGAVRLLEVQPPGKRTMAWGDFVRGHDVAAGAVFGR